MTRRNLTPLAALQHEDPAKAVSLVRLLWPDIRAALDRGHTLKVIHERLEQAGLSIRYRQLSACVRRLRQEAAITGNRPDGRTHGTADASGCGPALVAAGGNGGLNDPLANIRERLIRNRPGFQHDDNPPDRRKLIG